MNLVTNLRVSSNTGKFLTSSGRISFLGRTAPWNCLVGLCVHSHCRKGGAPVKPPPKTFGHLQLGALDCHIMCNLQSPLNLQYQKQFMIDDNLSTIFGTPIAWKFSLKKTHKTVGWGVTDHFPSIMRQGISNLC